MKNLYTKNEAHNFNLHNESTKIISAKIVTFSFFSFFFGGGESGLEVIHCKNESRKD